MNVVIFHGSHGSPDGNWFPWLKQKLEELDISTDVPRLPTPENQSPETWFEAINNITINEYSVVIGHSTGANFLLHLLEKNTVAKAIFVGVVIGKLDLPEYDALNKPFLKTPGFDWSKISENAGEIHILHGDNDPYVDQVHSEFLQNQIGGDLQIIPGGGHLNAESGYDTFELGLKLIVEREYHA